MQHDVIEVVLKSGAKGLLLNVPSASAVGFLFNFRAGDRYVSSRNKTETAHLMEHMVLGANQHIRSARGFTAELQKNGAYANASTGRVQMTYDALCPVFEWERVFGLLQDAITAPLFTEEEFIAESGNVKEEFRDHMNNHSRALWQRLDQVCGCIVPTDQERFKLMKNVTLRNVRDHYKRTHTSKNMRFIIAGPIGSKMAEIKSRLESWDLPKGEYLPWREDEMTAIKPLFVKRKGVKNIFYNFQWIFPYKMDTKQQDILDCANHILAGTLFSRILGEARERGLAYHLWADQYTQNKYSVSEYGGQVSADNAQSLMEIASRHIKEIASGKLSDEEVRAAHDYGLGKIQMGYQTVGSIMRYYADDYFFHGSIEPFKNLTSRINAVTKNDVVEIINSMINSGHFGFAALSEGPSDIASQMAQPFDLY